MLCCPQVRCLSQRIALSGVLCGIRSDLSDHLLHLHSPLHYLRCLCHQLFHLCTRLLPDSGNSQHVLAVQLRLLGVLHFRCCLSQLHLWFLSRLGEPQLPQLLVGHERLPFLLRCHPLHRLRVWVLLECGCLPGMLLDYHEVPAMQRRWHHLFALRLRLQSCRNQRQLRVLLCVSTWMRALHNFCLMRDVHGGILRQLRVMLCVFCRVLLLLESGGMRGLH